MIIFSFSDALKSVPNFAYTYVILLLGFLIAAFVQRFLLNRSETETDIEFVRSVAKQALLLGADNYSTMLENVEDAASYSGVSPKDAGQILDEEKTSLITEQDAWPKLTEVDRLNAAFLQLEALGYHTGGGMVDDAGFEVSKAKDKFSHLSREHHSGYIFYDRDSAEETIANAAPIYFWYGTARRKTNASDELRVVTDLNKALRDQGLNPDWDGTLKTQLSLHINWQVRWDETRAKKT